jgi:hypothetical protein
MCLSWLLSRGKRERDVLDVADKLQMSMRTTAKCRYNASARLQSQGKYSFFTTTILSLGLVFIPLMQSAAIPLAFKANVLNVMQIFLGVAVMVYSLVISTARYDLRAAQLTECGDKLKELIRDLDREREAHKGSIPPERLEQFQKTYSDVVTDVENHERNDYRFASLEMPNDYFLTGIPRAKLFTEAHFVRLFGFLLPTALMLIEAVFIADMMWATNIFRPYLNGTLATGG